MSPVARSTGHAGRALTLATVAIIVLIGGLFLAATFFSGQKSANVALGDSTFQGGNAERLAAEIDDRGPIIYTDVSGKAERDLILQHLGSEVDEGWYAFLAQPPGKARDCTWQWKASEELFVARCDSNLTAPADGEGLVTFPVAVVSGKLDIDLNYADRTTIPATTTTSSTIPRSGTPNGD